MSMIAITKVITQADKHSHLSLIQSGNQKWVTAIETINASGWVLPLMVIFAGKIHCMNWFENTEISLDWTIAVSDNDWMNDQLGFDWLQFIFKSNIKDCMKGLYQLLIFNRHNSHFTSWFNLFCTEYKIISICMPSHSSHIFQSFDISCFSVLKHSYSHQVEQFMWYDIDFINKSDFLVLYNQAHTETYLSNTIHNGFKATELVPYDSIQVLLTF